MLSISECKKLLKSKQSDEEIEKLRDEMYEIAQLLADAFRRSTSSRTNASSEVNAGRSEAN